MFVVSQAKVLTTLKCNKKHCVNDWSSWKMIDELKLMNWRIQIKCPFVFSIYLIINDSVGSHSMWAYQRNICGQFGTLNHFWGKWFFSKSLNMTKNLPLEASIDPESSLAWIQKGKSTPGTWIKHLLPEKWFYISTFNSSSFKLPSYFMWFHWH